MPTALNVSAWEVLEAASTKPYGFMPHDPGPGVGGSCIPVIPFFLADVAERLGTPSHLIAAAERVNTFMPQYVTDRAAALVGRRDGDLAGCHILVLGVTYKPDQSDCRHSPAVPVVERLIAAGATVRVHDPLVTEVAGLHPDRPALRHSRRRWWARLIWWSSSRRIARSTMGWCCRTRAAFWTRGMRCATGQRQTWYRCSRNPEAGDGPPMVPPLCGGTRISAGAGMTDSGYFS